MDFLVTTRLEKLQEIAAGRQVVMVDGTVPNWEPQNGDLHFDHHRPNGPAIQLDDLGEIPGHDDLTEDALVVTTQVDADACAAAAWLLVDPAEVSGDRWDKTNKIRAIAYDCDHLCVPAELSKYADFAAQAVAALKSTSNALIAELGLSPNRREWSIEDKERFASEAFRQGTEWLIAALKGERPFPGEQGEAKQYWEQVESNIEMIIRENRIALYKGCLIFNGKGLGGTYIDPRCWLRAAQKMGIDPQWPVTVTQREVIVSGEFKGFSYTLGTVPLHPKQADFDYTQGYFDALTQLEREENPDADGWGGRATVGGSGWNTPSALTPHQVIDTVLKVFESNPD